MAAPMTHPDGRRRSMADVLQSEGRYAFTLVEAKETLGRSPVAVGATLRRLKNQGRIVSPRRGFFVIVPLEYRATGCPPATWFIDDLMRHMRQPYYVGVLTAAALHGAAHQQPMAFQVVTDRPTRPVVVGRVRIDFHQNRGIHGVPTTSLKTETGSMTVSTPETTVLDLVHLAAAGGHLNNVTTVIAELSEKLDHRELAKATTFYSAPDLQRLGFLLELINCADLAEIIEKSLAPRRLRPVLLDTSARKRSRRLHPRWRILMNTKVEVDT